jgi:hypothetical protein
MNLHEISYDKDHPDGEYMNNEIGLGDNNTRKTSKSILKALQTVVKK